MKRPRATSLGALLILNVAGCGASPSGPGADFPSVSGVWSISPEGFPGLTTGADGVCVFADITIRLTRAGDAERGDQYRGEHDGVQIECTGISPQAAAASGLADGVIVLPPDTMSAVVGNFCTPVFGGDCDSDVDVDIDIGDISFIGELSATGFSSNERTMSGGFSLVTSDTIRISGAWLATR